MNYSWIRSYLHELDLFGVSKVLYYYTSIRYLCYIGVAWMFGIIIPPDILLYLSHCYNDAVLASCIYGEYFAVNLLLASNWFLCSGLSNFVSGFCSNLVQKKIAS